MIHYCQYETMAEELIRDRLQLVIGIKDKLVKASPNGIRLGVNKQTGFAPGFILIS